jgi:hypothetical protein
MNPFPRAIKALSSGTLFSLATRRCVRWASGVVALPFGFLVETGCLERPAHAYCMWNAARLARELGYREISVAEFGVAGGVTFLILERYAATIFRELGVRIQVYGFDTGGGLPEVEGVADLPYWFQPTQYAMNVELLKSWLTTAELVIGNVRDTVAGFFAQAPRPPLAAIFNDLDYFSSSRDMLRILDTGDTNFLPRLFMYLDDVVGGDKEMYGPFNGELLANEQFNGTHDRIKIHLNQNLLPTQFPWRTQIYYIHLFDHPRYGDYVGAADQDSIASHLQLNK